MRVFRELGLCIVRLLVAMEIVLVHAYLMKRDEIELKSLRRVMDNVT